MALLGDRAVDGFRLGYRPALDGVRAVAVLMVMWHHTFVVLMPWARGSLSGGFTGVDVFFVLSGFLITSLLVERVREDRFTYVGFYRRRALRLLPALFAFLVADTIIAWGLHNNMGEQLRSVIGAVTYTTNWAPLTHFKLQPDLIHLWSLAIEEQFYMVWPVLLVFLLRRRPRTMFVVLLGAVVGIALWRYGWFLHYGRGFPIVYLRTDTRADGLLVGALLSLALHLGWRPSAILRRVAGWAGLVVLVGAVLLGRNAEVGAAAAPFLRPENLLYEGGFTLVALAAAGLILAALGGPGRLQWALARRPAVAIGRASYSLYLWHPIVFELVSRVVPGAPLRIAVAWPASLAAAWLSRKFVEKPFLALGARDYTRADPRDSFNP